MARPKYFMRSGVAVATTGVLLLGAAGLAVAAIPDGTTFTGCYDVKYKTGNLRVIDASKQCLAGETRITWNQAGQPGAAGEPGGPGAAGAKGEQGEKGEPGQDATIADGSIDGESDNTARTSPQGSLALNTVGRGNLVDDAIDTGQIADGAVEAAQLNIARVATVTQDGSISVATEGVSVVTLPISGLQPGDLVTVDNPSVGGLIQHVSTGIGIVTIRLYNVSTTQKTVPGSSTWTITWADLTP